MNHTRNPASALAGLFALVAVFLWSSFVAAQTQPPPLPASLNAIAYDPASSELTLTFAPLAPKFDVVRNDGTETSVGFALSSRATSASIPAKLGAPLRSISFEQADTILILKLASDGPVRLAATAKDSHTIAVKITALAAASVPSDIASTQPRGPLPKAARLRPGADNFEVVPLKYADVSEVVGLLSNGQTIKPNDSFTPNEPGFGSAGMNGTAAYTPPPLPNADLQSEPVGQSVDEAIGVDRRLNAIILKGTPEEIERLKERIEKIDVPVQSVVLETMFVELTDSGARNVGLDFNNASAQLGVATFQTGEFIPPGVNTFRSSLTSASLQAAIYAEVLAGRGRIVSKPRIAAQSGSEAKIITGDQLPILTSIALSGVNGVSQQVQYVNVGVTLQIAPRVSVDGFVTSHVFGVVSSVTGFSQGYPTISQRKAETSVTVHDGETFVIGGLTQENDISNTQNVPWFSSIPLLGQLFQLHKDTNSKTELYIVVTPHIVTGQETPPPAP